jgi:hypothetical protein
VRKSVVVQTDAASAFEIFTSGIDSWWPKSHRMGGAPFRQSIIQPFVGGRWYAQREDGTELTIGHVKIWEPAARVVLSWEIGPDWQPDAELSSELEIRFVAIAAKSTRVELEHREFEHIRREGAEEYRNGLDRGWPTALQHYAAEVSRRLASR